MKQSFMWVATCVVIGFMGIVWELQRKVVDHYQNLFVRNVNVQERRKNCFVYVDNRMMTLSKIIQLVIY